MYSHGFLDSEMAQCVRSSAEGQGSAAARKTFQSKYKKPTAARASIRWWYQEYQARDYHSDMGGDGRP